MIKSQTPYNSKFVQKWLKVVHLNNLVQCGTTLVLEVIPFLYKFSKRYVKFCRPDQQCINKQLDNNALSNFSKTTNI